MATTLVERMKESGAKASQDYRELLIRATTTDEDMSPAEAAEIVSAAGRTLEQFQDDIELLDSRYSAWLELQGADKSKAEADALKLEQTKVAGELRILEEKYKADAAPLLARQTELAEKVRALRDDPNRGQALRVLNSTTSHEAMDRFRKASSRATDTGNNLGKAQSAASDQSMAYVDQQIKELKNSLDYAQAVNVPKILEQIAELEKSKVDRVRDFESLQESYKRAEAERVEAESRLRDWQTFRLADEPEADFFGKAAK